MPRRFARRQQIRFVRDRRGRLLPVGAFAPGGVRRVTITVRRDPRTGQFIPKRGPVPRITLPPRHPRTGRFITQVEAEGIRRKRPPITDAIIAIMRRRYPNLYQRYLQMPRERQRDLLQVFGANLITTEPIQRKEKP